MDPTRQLAAELDADRRAAWEQMDMGQRLLAGPAMFDISVMMMRAGIRLQVPEADDESIEQILVERLRKARQFETNA